MMNAVFAVVSVVFAVWLLQLLLALRVWRAVPPVSSLRPPPLSTWPKLSMVVPARDEATRIEGALASKLACGYPALEVVAVDDRSRDETGAILDRMAQIEPRLVVTHVTELPEGWLGKLHAMSKGLERATGDWVLFSDADVHLEAGVLERLVAHAESEQIDLVAVFPQMHPVHPVLDAGLAVAIRFLALAGRTWLANDDRSRIGVAVGAFSLVRRKVLESTDALRELRMEIADDVALGALVKQSGARTRFFAGRREVHVVFQESFAAAARSADKGGGMLGFVLWMPIMAAVLPVTLDLGVPLWAISMGGLTAALGAAALAAATLTHLVIGLHFRGPLLGAILWPIGHFVNAALILGTGVRTWRQQGIRWRNTFYSRGALEAGRRLDPASLRIERR